MTTPDPSVRSAWWRRTKSERPTAGSSDDAEMERDRNARKGLRYSLSLPRGFRTSAAFDQDEFDRVSLAIVSQLLCRACSSVPRDAVALPCGHCICRTCMKDPPQLTTCPSCQADYPLSAFHLWSFPDNPLPGHVVRRLSLRNEAALGQRRPWWHGGWTGVWRTPMVVMPTCSLCETGSVAHRFCVKCQLNYCHRCLKKEHTGREFGSHKLKGPVPGGRNPCRCHRTASQTHYCFTDHTGACEGCVEKSHSDHDVTSVDDALCLKKAFVQSVVGMAERAQVKYSGVLKVAEDDVRVVSQQAEELERRLKQGFAALHTALRAQEKQLRSQIDAQVRGARRKGEVFVEQAQAGLSYLDSLLLVSEEARREQNAVVFLKGADSLGQLLYGAIGKLYCLGKGVRIEPLEDIVLDFRGVQEGLTGLLEKHLLGASSTRSGWMEGGSQGPPQLEDCPAKVRTATDIRSSEAECEVVPLAPRTPTVYQHDSTGFNVKVFWTAAVGEEVESLDTQFQNTGSAEAGGGERVLVEGPETRSFQTGCLTRGSDSTFQVRSAGRHGWSRWSHPYLPLQLVIGGLNVKPHLGSFLFSFITNQGVCPVRRAVEMSLLSIQHLPPSSAATDVQLQLSNSKTVRPNATMV